MKKVTLLQTKRKLDMNSKLLEYLKNNKMFKLVCGAGNENEEDVEKLVELYSMAGCNIFDVSANLDVVKAAKRGLKKAGILENRFICVSVGIKGDPHLNKANIDLKKCKGCLKCFSICPQSAISSKCVVDETKCIGCSKCQRICIADAIEMKSHPTDLSIVLPKIVKEGVDCLEFHAISNDENDVDEKWKFLNSLYNGVLSICVDRAKLSNEALISRLNRMLSIREPYTTIIQADGAPMSGGKNDYRTTLQAVATAELLQKEKLPVFTLLSGGTNSKTAQLATQCDVEFTGVAIGSYARYIVKDYLCGKMSFGEALKIAKNLVDSVY